MTSLLDYLGKIIKLSAPPDLPAQASQEFTYRLHNACIRVVSQSGVVLGEHDKSVASVFLAILLFESTGTTQHSLWYSPVDELIELAEESLPRWKLIIKAVKTTDRFTDLGKDAARLEEFLAQFERFEKAVGPKQISSLLADAKAFRARFNTYKAQAILSDEEIEGEAKRHFQKCQQDRALRPDEVTYLVNKLTLPRLRTYSDEQYEKVAANFIRWNPIFHFFQENQPDQNLSTHAQPNAQEQQAHTMFDSASYLALLNNIDQRIARHWPTNVGAYSAKDALDEAVARALKFASTPAKGYCFEGDFPHWLYTTAQYVLREWLRKAKRENGPLPPNVIDPRSPENDYEKYADFFETWRLRYLFVESFFRPDSWPSVKAIFADALQSPDGKINYEEVADAVEQATGVRPSPNTLMIIKSRLRLKLSVLRWILDEVPIEVIDQADELRPLITLTYACKDDLRWGIIARGLIDKKGQLAKNRVQSCGEWLDGVAGLFALSYGLASSHGLLVRADFAWRWVAEQQPLIRQARQILAGNDMEFFLAACWYLAIIKQYSAGQAIDVLHPAPHEKEGVANTVTRLQGAEQGAPPMDDGTTPPTGKRPTRRQRSAPRDAIMAFLTGDHLDRAELTQAVQDMATTDPAQLAQLRQRLQTGGGLSIEDNLACEEVAESLVAYAALGDQAAERMPDIAQHLQGCEQCSADLEALRESTAQLDGGLNPISQWVEETGKSLVMLTKQGWQLLGKQVSAISLSVSIDAATNQIVSIFKVTTDQIKSSLGNSRPKALGYRGDERFSFPNDVQPSFTVNISLPDNVAKISFEVIPGYLSTNHTFVWSINLTLDDSSLVEVVSVGLGNEESDNDSTTVYKGETTKLLPILPQANDSYWLYCKWKNQDNRLQTAKFKLPLSMESTGGER